ncbi:MAG: geranylgeranylglyceryl/heptaprenylglyceryl phosphate synthase [Bacteroidetes bacterium]|nr:geranylgeranylglyceryl/heptaprenylglyceryl phosphate synthase [Bacteroidota bacterium]
MTKTVYSQLDTGRARLAVLIDPDNQTPDSLRSMTDRINSARVDMVLVGGSLLLEDRFGETIRLLKKETSAPVVIFPGNNYQVSRSADAILLLSLISGRNPEYLIGQHVVAAPHIRESGLEVIPTGYMLIDGGRVSTTSYMTQTVPIPHDKADIAVATAMAGELLGLRAIYLEAGSGARQSIPTEMLTAVRKAISIPIITGGGIRTPEQAEALAQAGSNLIVVGNVLEKQPELLLEISLAVHG